MWKRLEWEGDGEVIPVGPSKKSRRATAQSGVQISDQLKMFIVGEH